MQNRKDRNKHGGGLAKKDQVAKNLKVSKNITSGTIVFETAVKKQKLDNSKCLQASD